MVRGDEFKLAVDKAALQKGLIVEGNRILIPSDLLTFRIRPFFDKLLKKASGEGIAVRFIAPTSKSDEDLKVITSEFKTKKPAIPPQPSNKNYYIIGGAILLTAGLTAFFMRRR